MVVSHIDYVVDIIYIQPFPPSMPPSTSNKISHTIIKLIHFLIPLLLKNRVTALQVLVQVRILYGEIFPVCPTEMRSSFTHQVHSSVHVL